LKNTNDLNKTIADVSKALISTVSRIQRNSYMGSKRLFTTIYNLLCSALEAKAAGLTPCKSSFSSWRSSCLW